MTFRESAKIGKQPTKLGSQVASRCGKRNQSPWNFHGDWLRSPFIPTETWCLPDVGDEGESTTPEDPHTFLEGTWTLQAYIKEDFNDLFRFGMIHRRLLGSRRRTKRKTTWLESLT